MSAVVLVYWSYIQSKATLSAVTAAGPTKRSGHDQTNRVSDGRNPHALSALRSAAMVALTVVVAGLGPGSASVYREVPPYPRHDTATATISDGNSRADRATLDEM